MLMRTRGHYAYFEGEINSVNKLCKINSSQFVMIYGNYFICLLVLFELTGILIFLIGYL